MKLAFLLKDLNVLPVTMTSWLLIAGAVERGHEVTILTVDRLSLLASGHVGGSGRVVPPGTRGLTPETLRALPVERLVLEDLDAILVRTNPARDPRTWAHETALELLGLLEDRGLCVLNPSASLRRAASKLYLARLPEECRPQTIVSADPDEIRAFAASTQGRWVIKPLRGTRGRGVFALAQGPGQNQNQIIESVLERGYAMVQTFVPEARDGDMRVIMLEGQVLSVDGHIAAVRRVPAGSDFRSNIHAGGIAQPAAPDGRDLRALALIGDCLRRDGVFLAGVDLIGARAVEVNVFSTGGIFDAQRFSGRDFVGAILDAVARRFGLSPAAALSP